MRLIPPLHPASHGRLSRRACSRPGWEPAGLQQAPAPAPPPKRGRSVEGLHHDGASLGDGLTAADAVRQQALQFVGDVGHELGRTGEAQKARGVEAIRSFARAVDSAADEIKPQSPIVARTVHEAARRVEGLSDNLPNRNINELIESAAQLARAQPALFIGGSVAAGFALARFVKSSARQRPAASYDPSQREDEIHDD